MTLQCVYPVNASKYELEPGRNENIRKLNRMLTEYAEKSGLGLIDLTDSLKAENGSLDVKYSDDGVHPNAAGFEIVARAIASKIN
ncbi:MAG: SGNH/GDSL hydrolase family protein [Oscillospiraceae bacterium]|nr:SGNH/GDSL hydrolase family protein [Oscillospiraceae bacterium]